MVQNEIYNGIEFEQDSSFEAWKYYRIYYKEAGILRKLYDFDNLVFYSCDELSSQKRQFMKENFIGRFPLETFSRSRIYKK